MVTLSHNNVYTQPCTLEYIFEALSTHVILLSQCSVNT
jgi:hypothetical protein